MHGGSNSGSEPTATKKSILESWVGHKRSAADKEPSLYHPGRCASRARRGHRELTGTRGERDRGRPRMWVFRPAQGTDDRCCRPTRQ